jgi:hypothetical protein
MSIKNCFCVISRLPHHFKLLRGQHVARELRVEQAWFREFLEICDTMDIVKKILIFCLISGFRGEVAEKCALLGHYAAENNYSLRNNLEERTSQYSYLLRALFTRMCSNDMTVFQNISQQRCGICCGFRPSCLACKFWRNCCYIRVCGPGVA